MHAQRILVADDDEAIGLVVRLALRRAGYEVEWVDNATAALEAVRSGGVDALLLDWMLPDMDGIEACRLLKTDPATCAVPIVFLTAASHDGAHAEALAAGATGVIAKPFSPLELGARVKALLGQ
jgi:DNA-binding response OmpR family regulator